MNKNWYLGSAIVGGVATCFIAAQHQLVWTIVGAVSVGLNIYNYYNVEDKEGD